MRTVAQGKRLEHRLAEICDQSHQRRARMHVNGRVANRDASD